MIAVVGAGPRAAEWALATLERGGLPVRRDLPDGLYFATNPGRDGHYLFPEELAGIVALVSPTGLERTDPAFLERVLLVADPGPGDGWLVTVHDVLADVSMRGLPFWSVSVVEPVLEGLGPWLGQGAFAMAPSPLPTTVERLDPVPAAIHAALATRGDLDDELTEALVARADAARK